MTPQLTLKEQNSSSSIYTSSAKSTLTRSLSERQQTNAKNKLNSFNSCSSEIYFTEAPNESKFKTLPNECLIIACKNANVIYDFFDYNKQVPVKSDLNVKEISKDVSVQVNLNCWNHGSDLLYFKSLANLIIPNTNQFLAHFDCSSICNQIKNQFFWNNYRRFNSLPSLITTKMIKSINEDELHIIANGIIEDINFELVSKNVAALLSPHQCFASRSNLCNNKNVSLNEFNCLK